MKRLALIFAVFTVLACAVPLAIIGSALLCGLPDGEPLRTLAWVLGLATAFVGASAYGSFGDDL